MQQYVYRVEGWQAAAVGCGNDRPRQPWAGPLRDHEALAAMVSSAERLVFVSRDGES
jgi:hypothetical protein